MPVQKENLLMATTEQTKQNQKKTPQVIQTHPRDFTLVILIRENEVVKKRRKYEFPSPFF